MDISCSQIQEKEIQATDMSYSQMLEQIISGNTNTWPADEDFSEYIMNAPLGTLTSLMTAQDEFQVTQMYNIHITQKKKKLKNFHVMQNNMILTTSRTCYKPTKSTGGTISETNQHKGAAFETNQEKDFIEVQIQK